MSETRSEHEQAIRQKCCINGSELCYWLDKKGCLECYIATIKSDNDKQDALARWKTTISYLPDDFDEMHLSDDCAFCIGEPKKVSAYALFDMANPEPKAEKGMFFGIGKKVRTPIGSLITVQAGICNDCKKAYRAVDMYQILVPLLFVALSIILLTIPAFAQPMSNLFAFMPLIFVVLMGVAGFYLGKYLGRNHIARKSKTVKFDLGLIPQVKRMLNRNWFFFQSIDGLPRLSFTKQKHYKSLMKMQEKISQASEIKNDVETNIKTDSNSDNNDDTTLDNFNI